jgi:hypothetical protein
MSRGPWLAPGYSAQPMKLLPALALLVPACGMPLIAADLRPFPSGSTPPMAVVVTAAAGTEDLVRHSEEAAVDASTLVVRMEYFNRSYQDRHEDPSRYRLSVVSVDGQRVTALPVAWGALPVGRGGALPDTSPPAGASLPLVIPARQGAAVWVAFRGLTGLSLAGPARLELVAPGEDGDRLLVLAAPAAPTRWTSRRGPRALVLRAGLSYAGRDHLAELGMQAVFARGPWVFGMSVLDHADLVMEKQPGSYQAAGVGLFGGVQPRPWAGVVVGADGLWGMAPSVDHVARADLLILRTYAALRFQAGQPLGIGGGVLPVRHGWASPLRSLTLDVGYCHMFVRGPHASGGGPLLIVGAPLASF